MYNKNTHGAMKTNIIVTIVDDLEISAAEHEVKCDKFNEEHEVHFNTHTHCIDSGKLVLITTMSYTEKINKTKPLPVRG